MIFMFHTRISQCIILLHLCTTVLTDSYVAIQDATNNGTSSIDELSLSNVTVPVPSIYQAELVLSTTLILDTNEELERKLVQLISDSQKAAEADHYKVNRTSFAGGTPTSGIIVKVWKRIVRETTTTIIFTTKVNNKDVIAEVILEDISRLTPQHVSAVLHYPFQRILTQKVIEEENTSKWWIILSISGVGVLILLLGWLFLFVYFNTCGRTTYVQSDRMMDTLVKRIYVKECEAQTESEARQDDNTIQQRDPFETLPRKKQRPPELEIVRNHMEAEDSSHGNREMNVSFEKRREENDVVTLDEAPNDNEEEIRTDTQNSWENSPRSDTTAAGRPKTAGKKRKLRDRYGNVIRSEATKEWSTYDAGTTVSALYNIGPGFSTDHPRPLLPTDNGILELRVTSRGDNFVQKYL